MSTRLRAIAGLAMLCLASAGCRTAMQCGADCDGGCGRGQSLAFTKYDCSCEEACGACTGSGTSACATPCGEPGCADGCGQSCRRSTLDKLCGCTGCGDLYWCEWYNDPPALCQPCDCGGNYTGPGASGYYRAPYRRHDGMAAVETPNIPPLHLADEPDAEKATH